MKYEKHRARLSFNFFLSSSFSGSAAAKEWRVKGLKSIAFWGGGGDKFNPGGVVAAQIRGAFLKTIVS